MVAKVVIGIGLLVLGFGLFAVGLNAEGAERFWTIFGGIGCLAIGTGFALHRPVKVEKKRYRTGETIRKPLVLGDKPAKNGMYEDPIDNPNSAKPRKIHDLDDM